MTSSSFLTAPGGQLGALSAAPVLLAEGYQERIRKHCEIQGWRCCRERNGCNVLFAATSWTSLTSVTGWTKLKSRDSKKSEEEFQEGVISRGMSTFLPFCRSTFHLSTF